MACAAQKKWSFLLRHNFKTLTQHWKLKAGYKLALPQTEAGDRMLAWELIYMRNGHFSPMAEEQWTQLKKLLLPRKQLFCRAKRHINAPTNYRTGVTWRTRRFDLEKCDLALTTHPGFQCCSSLLQLSIMWPSMNLLCSRCGFPVC